jgi:hypothetical protein
VTSLSPLGLAALELAQEAGFSVFPLTPRGKTPLLAAGDGGHGYLDATTHPEQIAAWWDATPRANVGLYPGASQLIVLDVDGPEGERIARSLGAFDVHTLEVVTQRGAHRYFRLPPGVTFSNRSPWPELDVRAHGGYVLAPPSIHPSGHVYGWRGDFDAIAAVPAAVLAGLQPTPSPAVVAPSLPRPTLAVPDDRMERRVLAYADKLGYGLSDGRKTGAFRFAAFLAHDVGLGESAVWEFVATWNRHNAPALPEQLLAEIVSNARRYGGRRWGAAA